MLSVLPFIEEPEVLLLHLAVSLQWYFHLIKSLVSSVTGAQVVFQIFLSCNGKGISKKLPPLVRPFISHNQLCLKGNVQGEKRNRAAVLLKRVEVV